MSPISRLAVYTCGDATGDTDLPRSLTCPALSPAVTLVVVVVVHQHLATSLASQFVCCFVQYMTGLKERESESEIERKRERERERERPTSQPKSNGN